MRARLFSAPWVNATLTQEAKEAIDIIGDNVWREASIHFIAEREYKLGMGKSAPKGMQKYLNEVLDTRFSDKQWFSDLGYYFKKQTWIRVTFRHQMSLGSDILDAIKVCKKEGMQQAIIFAANRKTLDLITPNDASALVSFEKLQHEILGLNGALDIPLLIGELTPLNTASVDIDNELKKQRPRDTTIPIQALTSSFSDI